MLMLCLGRAPKSRALAFLRRLTNRKATNTTKQRPQKDLAPVSTTKSAAGGSENKENDDVNTSSVDYVNSLPAVRQLSFDEREAPEGFRSSAPNHTATNRHASHSDVDGQSKAGTSGTVGMSTASNGGNSIFSSPNQSSRSLSTTLTTIQSQAPSVLFNHQSAGGSSTYAQPPTSAQAYNSAPASAIPAYLNRGASSHVPSTYRSATANNLLSDNASVLTLASSSHQQHRRDSWDEDASIRALPPRSTWGGSRESLPLSVLSHNQGSEPLAPTSGALHPPQQRFSTSTTGNIGGPLLSSERNSVYAGKSTVDTSSIRSGQVGHARSDSNAASMSSVLPVTREQFGGGGEHAEQF